MDTKATSKVNSRAEDLFVELFCETFGPEKANHLYVQYPFVDIYGNHRFIDFALENQEMKIAIEIDGETYHNPKKVSDNKYFDDLLKQNSMVFNDWHVYRWAYNQLLKQPERVKDELVTFLGERPFFKAMQEFLPEQQGKIIELREYQQEAIDNLKAMRENGETIALLYHATGVGKIVTAATDAKMVGGRTLFLVNTLKLADQAETTFRDIWPEADRGMYTGLAKNSNAQVLFSTVQTMSRNLLEFRPDTFDYIIVDECHHAAAKTYQKIFSYFNPKFVLGLSATPERSDGEDMLELFQNIAHKMDLETAVKRGILAPVRCIRVKTDIDLSEVRINGIKYNSQDLESKLFIPERNQLIVDTYVTYVSGRKTVIFCASVKHAEEIAAKIRESGVSAKAVSGGMKMSERNEILAKFKRGEIKALCACDLLNEGWDCPETEVLFMARPTMSKVLYTQQLGRGMRLSEGKEFLMVFDFVDNASQYNMPYSLHRLLKLKDYHPGKRVLGTKQQMQEDDELYRKGEKPEALIDYPVSVTDFEAVDVFNWQDEAAGMLSQMEFIRRVDVQSETVERYIREGKIIPDMIVPLSEHKKLKYFREETLISTAEQFGWTIIGDDNRKELFMDMLDINRR